jgi:hypothetical protein
VVSAFSVVPERSSGVGRSLAKPVRMYSWLLSLECHGVIFAVRVNSRALWNLVARRAAEFIPGVQVNCPGRIDWSYSLAEEGPAAETAGATGGVTVLSGRRRIGIALSRFAALQTLCSNLQMKMAELSPQAVFIHAGVVGWKGRAIVLPGRSFSGKSTLVAELLRRGATYYSDEFAVLRDGFVHAFPCPLHIRSQQGHTGRRIPALLMRAGIGTAPLPVGLILFLSFHGRSGWSVRRLSPGHGILGLLRNAVAARSRPAETLSALSSAVLEAPAYRGRRGEAGLAADRVFKLFNESWAA